jgi:hypothetical protein
MDGTGMNLGFERKSFGGGELPPGAVPVEKRTLARFVPPGRVQEPHGVPPIGVIGLPSGWVITELFGDDGDEIRVLPFRFPFHSRAYALRCGDQLCAVIRNVQAQELSTGNEVVIQYGEGGGWDAQFGRVEQIGALTMRVRLPDGALETVEHENVRFIGKVMCWWNDEAAKASHRGA